MSTEDVKGPALSVIHGEGTPRKSVKPELALVSGGLIAPLQLVLPGLSHRRDKIVSVGFDGLDFPSFVQLLQLESIRRIVDIRASPSFASRGFSLPIVHSVFNNLNVEYEYFPELANRFIGESWNRHAVIKMYGDHLRQDREPLLRLLDRVAAGPVLLLGRTPRHESSARSVIVDELASMRSDFVLCIVNP